MLLEYEMNSYPDLLFSAFVGQIDLGVIVLNDNLRIHCWNDFVGQRSHKNLMESIGKPFVDVFAEADCESFYKMVMLSRNGSKHIYTHWPEQAPLVRLVEESNVPALQTTLFFPFEFSDGQRGFGLVMYDTSVADRSNAHLQSALNSLRKKQDEQDQLLLKLEAANARLLQSEKLAAIGQLAAGVGHEINNPIGYVCSNLKILNGYVQVLNKIIDAVDLVASLDDLRQLKTSLKYDYIRNDVGALISESEDGVYWVKRIISALKDFSYIEEEEFRSVDLHRGLETTLRVVNNELKYKAEVVKEYGDLPEVECIPSQINQVVLNLLVNAAHAIEQFGRITLRSGCEGEWGWIEVEDTGKGIEPNVLMRIFEPFFTTKPKGKGTGLGLSLSCDIVHKHNGRVEVHSMVGKGSRFRIWLPLRQPVESAAVG